MDIFDINLIIYKSEKMDLLHKMQFISVCWEQNIVLDKIQTLLHFWETFHHRRLERIYSNQQSEECQVKIIQCELQWNKPKLYGFLNMFWQ